VTTNFIVQITKDRTECNKEHKINLKNHKRTNKQTFYGTECNMQDLKNKRCYNEDYSEIAKTCQIYLTASGRAQTA